MLRESAELKYITNRVNMPTMLGSNEISKNISAKIRAQAFFSAKVSEAHILDRFRHISDDYSAGKIGRDEARALMKSYARANNQDDGTEGLKNLASSARLNLILDQNSKMSAAIGEYDRMYSETNKKVFPYLRFRASVGSKQPRPEHQQYDGMIVSKDDPFVQSHWPPLDFGCNCRWENVSAKVAEESGGIKQPKNDITPDGQILNRQTGKMEKKPGFFFNPAHAFEEFDLSSINSNQCQETVATLNTIAKKTKTSYNLLPDRRKLSAHTKPVKEPKNIDAIKENIRTIADVLTQATEAGQDTKSINFPDLKFKIGKLSPQIQKAFGQDGVQDMFFVSPPSARHWVKNHADTLNEETVLELFRNTIWHSEAKAGLTLDQGTIRLTIYREISEQKPYLITFVKKGTLGNDEWEWDMLDAWQPDARYLSAWAKKWTAQYPEKIQKK